ncbi:hypothetical protein [Methylophilus methylotrophus]|uniref:hypothetical protein n=1 Tax=Methylophilus methylotrophus TaxID=17 RepID=UPI000376A8DC|nr:hypothetical protein [Methylophilus methylotrophus]
MDYSLSSAGETYLPFTIETLKTELAKSLLYQKNPEYFSPGALRSESPKYLNYKT